MMLSGGEVAVKLAGSAAKNAAAMLLALARNHKKVYGKTSLKKILQQTRHPHVFPDTGAVPGIQPSGEGQGAVCGHSGQGAAGRAH